MRKGKVMIALTDRLLEDVTAELLLSAGFEVLPRNSGKSADYLVTDPASASEAVQTGARGKILMANVSGPGALAGSLARITVARFVPRPATARQILTALISVAESP